MIPLISNKEWFKKPKWTTMTDDILQDLKTEKIFKTGRLCFVENVHFLLQANLRKSLQQKMKKRKNNLQMTSVKKKNGHIHRFNAI